MTSGTKELPLPQDARELLSHFLDQVRKELQEVVDTTYPRLKDGELKDLLNDVWKGLAENFSEAKRQLGDIAEDKLDAVGLTGKSLRLKLRGFELAVANGVLKPILGWINIILGSLSVALPVLEPVKEYKEMLEELQ